MHGRRHPLLLPIALTCRIRTPSHERSGNWRTTCVNNRKISFTTRKRWVTSRGDIMNVQMEWRKSSHSTSAATCVEIASTPTAVWVRDTKNAKIDPLRISMHSWECFRETICDSSTFRPF
ncbi:DUF397 domain-containing protein [Streptomyces sp. NPDC059696]|uniref:DUF397 domain-containing protein n=1 Tax=Streptomyces sp. NPDC059696 TaxID=3346911 RepID=UPI0036C54327